MVLYRFSGKTNIIFFDIKLNIDSKRQPVIFSRYILSSFFDIKIIY